MPDDLHTHREPAAAIGQNEGMTFEGDLSPLDAPQRVSGMRVPDSWALPGKPEGLTPATCEATA